MTKQEYETKCDQTILQGKKCGVSQDTIWYQLLDLKDKYIESLEKENEILKRVNASSVSKLELETCRSLNEALREKIDSLSGRGS